LSTACHQQVRRLRTPAHLLVRSSRTAHQWAIVSAALRRSAAPSTNSVIQAREIRRSFPILMLRSCPLRIR
jgi:hypothetical protein